MTLATPLWAGAAAKLAGRMLVKCASPPPMRCSFSLLPAATDQNLPISFLARTLHTPCFREACLPLSARPPLQPCALFPACRPLCRLLPRPAAGHDPPGSAQRWHQVSWMKEARGFFPGCLVDTPALLTMLARASA